MRRARATMGAWQSQSAETTSGYANAAVNARLRETKTLATDGGELHQNTTVELSLNDDEMQSAVYTASVDTSPTSADDGHGGTSRTEYRGKWVRTGDFSFSAGALRCVQSGVFMCTAMERGILRPA